MELLEVDTSGSFVFGYKILLNIIKPDKKKPETPLGKFRLLKRLLKNALALVNA